MNKAAQASIDDRIRRGGRQEQKTHRISARGRALLHRLGHERTARATLSTTHISAVIWNGPSGSCSHAAETRTPTTGTTIVEIAATDAGKHKQ